MSIAQSALDERRCRPQGLTVGTPGLEAMQGMSADIGSQAGSGEQKRRGRMAASSPYGKTREGGQRPPYRRRLIAKPDMLRKPALARSRAPGSGISAPVHSTLMLSQEAHTGEKEPSLSATTT